MPSTPNCRGAAQQPDFIDQPGRDKGGRDAGAALHHQPGDALVRLVRAAPLTHRDRCRCRRTRITCAPAAPKRAAAAASDVSDVITHSGVWRAECTSRLPAGSRSARSSTTRTGDRASMPGSRQVKSGSSASTVPIPTRIASLCARSRCTRVARHLTGDGNRLAASASDLVVRGDRELEDHMRTLVADAPDVTGVIARGLGRAQTRCRRQCRRRVAGRSPVPPLPDWDPRSTATTRAIPAAMIASAQGGDLAEMRAGFERDIERGAARGVTSALQGLRLGMRTPAWLASSRGRQRRRP